MQAYLLAVQGEEEGCRERAARVLDDDSGGGHRARWALGLLELGHGRAAEALEHLLVLYDGAARHPLPAERSLPDLVEAAVRLGRYNLATGALTRFEHARTRLLYGEWLRRTRRKAEAREQHSAALETFDRIGAHPWAERTHHELTAGAAATTSTGPSPSSASTPAATSPASS
ncbi:hypothetical protein SAMN05444920_102141 [Nonomuraea solani]|uniref:Tetratricopeptide repeat-containing protein n=1 Tax=Nonomuraea solani TaxID=1144553 RepID=A0A1H5Y5A6_9ACTN|nr:hypothetical protein SAMN05444920_102141 [Nonomuraea solani]